MIYYYKPIYDGKNLLSCDMVRLKLVFKNIDCLNSFLSYLDGLSDICPLQVYNSYKDFSYRYLFVFGIKGHSFSIGLGLNGVKSDDTLYGFIEFNPNKILGDICFDDGFVYAASSNPFVTDEGFNLSLMLQDCYDRIFFKLPDVFHRCELVRFDVAYDVPIVRNKVQLIKGDNRLYSQFYKSRFNYTEYLGSPSSVGRVKIYNKSLESDLNYDLTRIEVTCSSTSYDDLYKIFPRVFVRDTIDLGETNIVVQLLEDLPTEKRLYYLNQFNRKTRYKYQELLLTEPLFISHGAWTKLTEFIQKEFVIDC